MRNRTVTFALAFFLSGLAFTLSGDRGIPRWLGRQEIIGEWVGLEQDGYMFCRMQLFDDGTGLLAEGSVYSDLKAWKITKWTASRKQLDLSFEVITKNTAQIEGQATTESWWESDVIRLTTKVPQKEQAQSIIVFRSEKDQSKILGELKSWMEKHPKEQK